MFRTVVGIFAMHAGAIALFAQDAGTTVSDASTKGYIELAARYGPFAFAVLTGLGVVWLIKLTRDCAGSDKPHVEALAATYKKFTVAAGLTALCFAGIGTYHWMRSEQGAQVFLGSIKDLKDYEQVDADSFYFKTELKKQLIGDTQKYRNEHFVAIQDHPFSPGQEFEIAYNKEGAKMRTTFKVKYAGGSPDFRIDYDSDSDSYVLKPVVAETAAGKTGLLFSNPLVVYAQTVSPVTSSAQATKSVVQSGPQAVDPNIIALLQNSSTPVGAKIDLLDKLRTMDATTLKAYVSTVTKQESFALTLIDLTRHSDKELSYKAKIVVEKSDAQAVIAQQFKSPDANVRSAAQQTVFRVSPERANEILKKAPASPQTQQLTAEVNSGSKQQVLIPVGSSSGDRYIVSMDWDEKDSRISSCMNTRVRGLLNTLHVDPTRFAGIKPQQTLSLDSKDNALKMFDAIQSCGAKAASVNPVSKK